MNLLKKYLPLDLINLITKYYLCPCGSGEEGVVCAQDHYSDYRYEKYLINGNYDDYMNLENPVSTVSPSYEFCITCNQGCTSRGKSCSFNFSFL